MKRKFVFLLTILLFSLIVFGQQKYPTKINYQTYHGKRVATSTAVFKLCGIRILESNEDLFYIDLFFNSELNPMSIRPDSFAIFLKPENPNFPPPPPSNKGPIPFRFKKSSKGIRLEVSKQQLGLSSEQSIENFTLYVQKVRSWENKELQPLKIYNLEINSQYHYSERENLWKKF